MTTVGNRLATLSGSLSRRAAMAAGALLLVAGLAGPASASEAEARKFMSDLADQAIQMLGDTSISEEERDKRGYKLLASNFATKTIGRFALGRYWRIATDAEKEEFLCLFEAFIVESYAGRFKDYEGQTFKVAGAKSVSDKDFMVSSTVSQPNGDPDVPIDWRVRKRDNGFQIVDIMVEGVSLAVTQQSEFGSVIQRGGGKVSALISDLKKRVSCRSS